MLEPEPPGIVIRASLLAAYPTMYRRPDGNEPMIEQSEATVGLRIVVNGIDQSVQATTLEALLLELGHGGSRVATAVNGSFVPANGRAGLTLSEGDRVEIVAPRQGG